jgi:orotate phosphoribosyltransferase
MEVKDLLLARGTLLENDHFVYISGDHGSGWIAKDVLFPHTKDVEELGRRLAEATRDWRPEWVCGPATGGLIIAQWTAHALGVPAYFAEHSPARPGELRGRFKLGRGYDEAVRGKPGLVVDDIVNTGHSIVETLAAVRQAGGVVAGAACLVTRGNVSDVGAPFRWLLEYRLPAWPEADCELCRQGVPVNTKYAHGADFLARR